ncbi:MAG: GHKL domain-containing protein [Lachnospiraceae bacterium]|nr:GHKL domain-containing protein [Lachnospiraceae bacterium]
MELQIVIISIITYLLLFNSCLTFRLNIIQNIVITIVLAVNIAFVGNIIGGLFVIPMFIILIMYIIWLKREDWLVNIFLIVFSYTLLVIVDNLTHFIWNIIGLNVSKHWPIYMIVDYPIFVVICRFMSSKIVKLKKKETLMLSPKILVILGTDLTLYLIIFVMNVTVVEQVGSSLSVLFSIILYIGYFLLIFSMVTTIVKEYDTNAKIILKQNSYDNLREYMSQIEELYQNLRVFKHDYANIMVSMAGYIEGNDMEGLKRYYDKQIFPISNQLIKANDAITILHNLDIVELKSLIFVKINHALELNIEVSLEITEEIETINMKSVDLVRIIGILLDNAIEACQECEHPSIGFSIMKMDNDVTFVIKNTYIKHDIDYSKLGSIGVSSKGKRRGAGLYNIKTITNDYDNVIMDTEYEAGYFTQVLEIYAS